MYIYTHIAIIYIYIYMYIYIYIYIHTYIYIYRERERYVLIISTHIWLHDWSRARACTANLRAKILDSRGLDSGIILMLRVGILRPIGKSPES